MRQKFLFILLLISFSTSGGLRLFVQNPVPHCSWIKNILAIDSTTIITVSDDNQVASTRDAGRTWTMTTLVNVGSSKQITRAGSSGAWIPSGYDSAYYSDDFGRHWVARKIRPGIRISSMSFVNKNCGYALGYGNFGPGYPLRGVVCRTHDGGVTWDTTIVDTSTYSVYGKFFFIDSLHGWAWGSNYLLGRTVNGGKTWVQTLIASLSDDNNLRDIHDLCFYDSLHGVAITSGRVFVSNDGGRTWSQRYSNGNVSPDYNAAISYHSRDTIMIAGIASTNPSTAFVIMNANGEQNWHGATGFSNNDGYYGFFAISSAQHVTWVGGGMGMVARTRNARDFEIISRGNRKNIRDMSFVSSRHGWTVGENGAIMCTRDGCTWTEQDCGSKLILNTVFFKDSLTGWIGGEQGSIFSTSDGGVTWDSVPSPNSNGIIDMFFTDALHGSIIDGSYNVSKTDDGGLSWNIYTPRYECRLKKIFYIDSMIGWAAGERSTLFKTVDGGKEWTTLMEPTSDYYSWEIRDLFFLDANTGWAVRGDSAVMKTVNGGVSWTNSSIRYARLILVCFINPSLGYVSDGSQLYSTSDGGLNWISVAIPYSCKGITCICAKREDNLWIAGESGVIAGTQHSQFLDTKPFYRCAPRSSHALNLTFAGLRKNCILFNTGISASVRCLIYSANGKLVYAGRKTMRTPGLNTEFIQRQMTAGLYVIVLVRDNERQSFPVCIYE